MSKSIQVLHVDDDPDFVDMAASLLEHENDRFTVETATSATEGLEQLVDGTFDCIVSDQVMPSQNGIEFLEAVREEYPELPFILFTGKGSEAVASDAISAGVTDYLQKEGSTEQYELLANRIENAVEQTHAQRERQRQLDAIETVQEGISILDNDGHYIYVNEAYAELYGYAPEELIGEHWELLYRNEDIVDIRETILPTARKTGYWHGTMTGLRADGSTFTADHVLATTEYGELVCTVREITDQEDLREKYELVARASADAFWDWNPITDEITRSNEYLTRFGYDASDVKADTDWWRERIHPDDRERVLMALERALAHPEATYDETYRFRKKDGAYGYIRSRGYVVYDATGEPIRMVGAHIDVTDRKTYEQTLEQQNERLEDFASIVSHDLRNPLTVAQGRLELVTAECDSEHLADVARAHERMGRLIDDLLQLARLGDHVNEMDAIDLAEMSDCCWQNVETAQATLVTETTQTIQADPSQLQQLLENLMRNAVEHGGDDVTVIVSDLDQKPGFYIADDGSGIPEDKRETIFERGYSMADQNTGIGLAIVKQIADAHSWRITVTDSEAGGAQFEISGVERGA